MYLLIGFLVLMGGALCHAIPETVSTKDNINDKFYDRPQR